MTQKHFIRKNAPTGYGSIRNYNPMFIVKC